MKKSEERGKVKGEREAVIGCLFSFIFNLSPLTFPLSPLDQ